MAVKRSVMKFGGTSVADLARIDNVAGIIAARAMRGEAIAVIVSAMSGRTDELLALAQSARDGEGDDGDDGDDECDAIIACGEQICAGMLALALRRRGCAARSWQGWQIGLRTTGAHGRARIMEIDADILGAAIDSGEIAVIAGFQGVSETRRITTLGRSGSDTSAIAVAVALGVPECDVYTDVDGVYTCDPGIVSAARRIARLSHEEMLEMASLGTKVLQTRSVELAMNYGIGIRVMSSFEPSPSGGTRVCQEDDIVEKSSVTGISYSLDDAKISVLGVDDSPGVAARVFACLAEKEINVDMIVQARAQADGRQNIVFTVPKGDTARTCAMIRKIDDIGYSAVSAEKDVSKVSAIGVGMRSHAGVAATMFETLSALGINIQVISTSEIKISVLIDAAYTELAVRSLHAAYRLDDG